MDEREPMRGRRTGGARRAEDQEHLFVAPADSPGAPADDEHGAPGYEPLADVPEDAGFRYIEPGQVTMANYRRRDVAGAREDDARESAFAAPPKLQVPVRGAARAAEAPLDELELDAAPQPTVNYYQTALPHQEQRYLPNDPYEGYQVVDTDEPPRKKRRRKRVRRRLITLAIVLAVLGGGAYLGRDWLAQQWRALSGGATTGGAQQAVTADAPAEAVKAYDPAPALEPGENAGAAIDAITGGLEMETFAVTGSNIVKRVPRDDGTHDYYLFTDTGMLVGYYEGIPAGGFVVCENDCFYVSEPPYLIGSDGQALLKLESFVPYTGSLPVLEPLQNGWAIIRDEQGTQFNYVTADGELLSTLWFAKAFPFLGSQTLAYVDSGNPDAGEERYSLYIIDQSGSAQVWKRTGNMNDVVGVACDMAYLQTGELIRLSAPDAPLCVTDELIAYVDCGAVVARDPQTGLYGLFVRGEQHYDFAYQSIQPVPCELTWSEATTGQFTCCAVSGASFPQPLSHYFALVRDGQTERIALSTGSTYPIALR